MDSRQHRRHERSIAAQKREVRQWQTYQNGSVRNVGRAINLGFYTKGFAAPSAGIHTIIGCAL
jgi:hypothetical protein